MKIPHHTNIQAGIPVVNAYENLASRKDDHKFYNGKHWRLTRRYILANNPTCAVCGTLANTVDHIQDRKTLSPELWYEPENLQSLCPGCHAKKRRASGKTPIH